MYQYINQLSSNPKILFLIDGTGAFITTFFLFVVLRTFNEYFGMPRTILTYLSCLALIFCGYSTACYFLLKKNWHPFLKAISIANLLYCCLTIGIVFYYYNNLTVLGITYFAAEIVVVCSLVFVELKALKQINQTT
jgi:hypothetical protein